VGTEDQPITFTTSSATPAPGQWKGIYFGADSDDARDLLEYVTVSYAGQWFCGWEGSCWTAGIGVYAASPTIRDTTVRQSVGHGLSANTTSLMLSQNTFEQNGRSGVTSRNSTLTLSNSTLRQNGWDGLWVLADGTVATTTLTANTFISNTQHAVYVQYNNGAGLPVLSGNTASGNGWSDGVAVEGTLSAAMTWPSDYGLPLVIVGDLTVGNGAELTVEPNAQILLGYGSARVTMARQSSKANRQPWHNGTVQVVVTRTAGRRGSGRGAGRLGGRPGGVAGPVSAVGPPNISSSRPPELAVAQVTGPRPAAAEHRR
jgi:hypothetical protein